MFNGAGRRAALYHCAVSNPIDLLTIWYPLQSVLHNLDFSFNYLMFSNFSTFKYPIQLKQRLIALEFQFGVPF